MKGRITLFSISLGLLTAGTLASFGSQKAAQKPSFQEAAKPVLEKYCFACHSGKAPAAGVDFSKFSSDTAVIQSPDIWTQAARYLASKHMPPAGNPQPSDITRSKLVKWIQSTLNSPCGLHDPGRVTIHRLNRAEYANTVRDLLGIEFKGTDDFPSDNVGYGFDNISDVLSMSPLLMEKYLNAAEQVAGQAVEVLDGQSKEYEATSFKYPPTAAARMRDDDLVLFSDCTVNLNQNFDKGGHFQIKVRAYGDQAGPQPCQMVVSLDNRPIGVVLVKGKDRAEAQDFNFAATIPNGQHHIGVAFTNDFYNPSDPNPKNRDRNLILESMTLQGPQLPDFEIPDSQARLIPHRPAPGQELVAAHDIFSKFASRAYRRPATSDEVDRLTKYVALALKNGDSFERGIQLGIEATLVSPNFLFRVETDPKPNDPNAKRLLNGYELASRLSYFLWSSMPDEKLYYLAADGELRKPDVLVAQAMRMLKDPKAKALSDNFATQWLTLRKLATASPDKNTYPEFDDQLRKDMEQETKDFFASIVGNDGSVLDFLDGKYTFINQRLAALYGIEGVSGDQFRKVSLSGTPRQGVLTQAAVLTVTSNPTRTSPVKRGKWVLEELLGTPPPPPPPGVGVLKEEAAETATMTLRERMELHRKNPMCAACHARMDPLGFGLENFDGVGKWRTEDGKSPIDSSGQLPDGHRFDGPVGLTKILMSQKDLFVRCLAEKLLTYALGRGLTIADQCVLDDIEKQAAQSNYRFSALVKAIVLSDPFRKRRGDGSG